MGISGKHTDTPGQKGGGGVIGPSHTHYIFFYQKDIIKKSSHIPYESHLNQQTYSQVEVAKTFFCIYFLPLHVYALISLILVPDPGG